MARYFFHLKDGVIFRDEDGAELPNGGAARREAARILAQLLEEKPEDFWADPDWVLTVTDERDLTLFTMELTATLAPASN